MTFYSNNNLNIKAWAEEDRPREKFRNMGKKHLTDAELLAILLNTGSRAETAVGLAQRILRSVGNNLNALGKCSVKELMVFRGIGEAKAITIASALEIGRRRQLSSTVQQAQMRSSKDAYQLIAPALRDLKQEEFWILLLNRSNRFIGKTCISTGGVSGTVVDAKVIFKRAIESLASSIILCHNHPSGNLKPSLADIKITQKLKRAGDSLDIAVLDHIIITDNSYYSFADEGRM
ncbi:MAG: DNA repair protein RadC [Bacteroidota bacterium]